METTLAPIRTDLYCTECSKPFIAQIDFSVDGNHIVECTHCRHEHCRAIKNGVVTDARWDSRLQRVSVDKACVWKADSQPIFSSTAAAFIRQSWLNKLDLQI